MSKIFIVENSDFSSLCSQIHQIGLKYGTINRIFTDMEIDLEGLTITKTYSTEEFLQLFGIPVTYVEGGFIPNHLRGQGGVAAEAVPTMPNDVVFVEYLGRDATSLVMFVKAQSILNASGELESYAKFVGRVRELAEYIHQQYPEDESLRQFVQDMVNARADHERQS